ARTRPRAPGGTWWCGAWDSSVLEDLADGLALLRLEAVLRAAVGPVAGERQVAAGDAALGEHAAQGLHGLALAVREDVHAALAPREVGDGVGQEGRRPGGCVAAQHPGDLDAVGRFEREAVRLRADLDQGVPDGVARHGLERGGDRGQG